MFNTTFVSPPVNATRQTAHSVLRNVEPRNRSCDMLSGSGRPTFEELTWCERLKVPFQLEESMRTEGASL